MFAIAAVTAAQYIVWILNGHHETRNTRALRFERLENPARHHCCICLLLNNDLAALIQSFASAGELQNGALETAELGHTPLTLGEPIKLALLTYYHRLPGTAVATLTFAPEDKEKGLGSETQVHRAQDSVVIDLSKDIVDWQGIVDHRR